jgi:hypothetical protein
MKWCFAALVIIGLSTSNLAPKPAMADDALVVSICNFVAADDKNRLRKKLRSSKVKLHNIYDEARCSGLTLLQFSMTKKSNNVGVYVVKRLPSSKLRRSGDLTWAADNGYADSVIAVAIKKRLASN